jgi:hypothetical protein
MSRSKILTAQNLMKPIITQNVKFEIANRQSQI